MSWCCFGCLKTNQTPIIPISNTIVDIAVLKDGSQVPISTLRQTVSSLQEVKKTHFIALIELVKKCQNPSYQISDQQTLENRNISSLHTLKHYSLVNEQGEIEETIRSIVLNAAEVKNLCGIILASPTR